MGACIECQTAGRAYDFGVTKRRAQNPPKISATWRGLSFSRVAIMNRLSRTAISTLHAARCVAAALVLVATADRAAAERVAKIQRLSPDGQLSEVAGDAITADGALKCALPEGDTTFILSLPQTSVLDRFDFVNENAEAQGELTIAVSNYQLPPTSPKWTNVDGAVAFSRKRLFNLSLVGVEAHYVKLSFHVAKGGTVAAQPIASTNAARIFSEVAKQNVTVAGFDFAERLPRGKMVDLAKLRAHARVAELSSGNAQLATRIIDGSTKTTFHFDPDDRRPFVIVELGEESRLNRVTAVYKSMRGRLDVYLLEDLGKNTTDLNYRRPVASYVDENGEGNVAVDFDPEGARYVALRWTPLDGGTLANFELAEVGAFGDVPMATVNAAEAPDLYAHNYGLPTVTGEGSVDFSNKLGTLADPPRLADVSP